MILFEHNICREEVEAVGLSGRLTSMGLDWTVLVEYVANFEAMELGWGTAQYARPGLCGHGRSSRWVIAPHAGLTH